ncbi:hypothetical protein NC652_002985 [Populus alba x Populus x berolinensis]|nr:hypothetical protein NC652_002985 [Populus alba x Populus x berolinensis]
MMQEFIKGRLKIMHRHRHNGKQALILRDVWQLYVAAVSWMSAAVTLQLHLSPNDACDYTAQRVFMCVILGHM